MIHYECSVIAYWGLTILEAAQRWPKHHRFNIEEKAGLVELWRHLDEHKTVTTVWVLGGDMKDGLDSPLHRLVQFYHGQDDGACGPMDLGRIYECIVLRSIEPPSWMVQAFGSKRPDLNAESTVADELNAAVWPTPDHPLTHLAPPNWDTLCGLTPNQSPRAYDTVSLDDSPGWCPACLTAAAKL